jgi:hypothetical protein
MRNLFTEIWLPSIFSGLSLAAFLYATWEGLKLADAADGFLRSEGEHRARRAAWVGAAFLVLAVLLWAAYLRYGPLHELGVQLNGD